MEDNVNTPFNEAKNALMRYLDDRSDVSVKVGCYVRTCVGITPSVRLGYVQSVDDTLKGTIVEVMWFQSVTVRGETTRFNRREHFNASDLVVVDENGIRVKND